MDEVTKRAIEKIKNTAEKTYWVDLPDSGARVKVKKPTFLSLVKKGVIPTHLLNLALKVQDGAGINQLTGDELKRFLQIMEIIVRESLVIPRIISEKDREEGKEGILIDELTDNDLQFIYKFVQDVLEEEGRELRSFRRK